VSVADLMVSDAGEKCLKEHLVEPKPDGLLSHLI
jgi:hypothetical protein